MQVHDHDYEWIETSVTDINLGGYHYYTITIGGSVCMRKGGMLDECKLYTWL